MDPRVAEVLRLPSGVSDPDSYQAVGLDGPLNDTSVVVTAIRETVARLKSVQADTDAAIWNAAAQCVMAAKAELVDPKRKSDLDRRLLTAQSAVHPTNVDEASTGQPAGDPLAGILPISDPLAGILPRASGHEPTVRELTPASPVDNATVVIPDRETASLPNETEHPIAISAVPRSSPGRRSRSGSANRSRARGVNVGTLSMFAVVIGLMGLVGVLAYVFILQPGAVSITRTNDGGVTISTAPVNSERPGSVVGPPGGSNSTGRAGDAAARDPVMGRLARSSDAVPATRANAEKPGEQSSRPNDSVVAPAWPMAGDDGLGNVKEPSMNPPLVSEPPMDSPAAADPAAGVNNPSAEIVLNQLRQSIRSQDWSRAQALTQSIRGLPMDAEQTETAESLDKIAELAIYYRGGIVKGIGQQEATRDFEVVPGFRVIIAEVDAASESIAVQYNAQTKRYTVDDLPLPLADRLASFAIPDGDLQQTAAAIYHCVATTATDEVREVEINYLRSLEEPVEEIPGGNLADAIESIF